MACGNLYADMTFLQFDWLRYLHEVYEDTNITIEMNEPVVLWMKQYFDELFDLLNRTSTRYSDILYLRTKILQGPILCCNP